MQPPHTLNSDTTTDLFYGILANDEAALKALYHQEYFKVQQYILDNNGSVELARDVYQEAFIAVWRNIQLNRFRPQNEASLGGYLYQVAKYKWIDYLRSGYYKKMLHVSNVPEQLDIPDELPEEELEYISEVKAGFQQLGDNCQEVLSRFYYKNQSMNTIAAAMKWTEATARNNKYRCIERLRALLKKTN